MRPYTIIDTGFWLAFFDPTDQRHCQAQSKSALLTSARVVMPWPIFYETMRTQFMTKQGAVRGFTRWATSQAVTRLDDSPYREQAFADAVSAALNQKRALSMVDCLIRLVLSDERVRIGYLLTYNEKDFRDICIKRRIELV